MGAQAQKTRFKLKAILSPFRLKFLRNLAFSSWGGGVKLAPLHLGKRIVEELIQLPRCRGASSETRFKLKARLSFSQSNFETRCVQARVKLAPPHHESDDLTCEMWLGMCSVANAASAFAFRSPLYTTTFFTPGT